MAIYKVSEIKKLKIVEKKISTKDKDKSIKTDEMLFDEIRSLIEQTRSIVAGTVNSARERKPWKESPIGLILCSENANEPVELLGLDGRDIKAADYWTQLPAKELLERKLHEAVIMARQLSERK